MGFDFLLGYLNNVFGKVILILVGLWLFETLFADTYLFIEQVASFALGVGPSYIFSREALVYARDFVIIIFSAHFLKNLFLHRT